MNLTQLKEQFDEQGFILIDNFFSDELMDSLHESILGHYGVDPDFWHNDEFLEVAQTEVIPWFPQNEGESRFDEIDSDERLQSLTNAILGEGWNNLYCMVMFSKNGTKGQAWHQDCAPGDPKIHNLNRLVYTRDIVPEIGGEVVVVPGSHKMGTLSIGDPTGDFEDQLVLRPKKGSLILLHGHAWHRVLPIKSQYRVSTNYRAIPQGAPVDLTDVCVYRNMRYHFGRNEIIEERA